MVPTSSYEISRASHYSGYYLSCFTFIYRTLTFYGQPSQTVLLALQVDFVVLHPKGIASSGLGSSYFARHYSRNRVFFLFLWLLRCFSSSRSPQYATLLTYWLLAIYASWVPSFGHLWINGYLLLPIAFRSLSRPSSASGAKAFPLCSYLLDLITLAFLALLCGM